MNRIAIIVSIAACAVVVWLFLGNSDERKIRNLFDEVATTFRKEGTEHPFESLAKARALARHVAPRLRVEMAGHGSFAVDVAELPQRLAILRKQTAVLKLSFSQLTVTVLDDGSRADAFCNATFVGSADWLSAGGEYAVTTELEKDASDGEWRFSAIHASPIVPQE